MKNNSLFYIFLFFLEISSRRMTAEEITKFFTLKTFDQEELYLTLERDYYSRTRKWVFSKKTHIGAKIMTSFSDTQCVVKIFYEDETKKRFYMKEFKNYNTKFTEQENDFIKKESEDNFIGPRLFFKNINNLEVTQNEELADEFLVQNKFSSKSRYDHVQYSFISLHKRMEPFERFLTFYLHNKNLTQVVGSIPDASSESFHIFLKNMQTVAKFESIFPLQLILKNKKFENNRKPFILSIDICPKLDRYRLHAEIDQDYCDNRFSEEIAGGILPSGIKVPEATKKKSWFCGEKEIILKKTKKYAFAEMENK